MQAYFAKFGIGFSRPDGLFLRILIFPVHLRVRLLVNSAHAHLPHFRYDWDIAIGTLPVGVIFVGAVLMFDRFPDIRVVCHAELLGEHQAPF